MTSLALSAPVAAPSALWHAFFRREPIFASGALILALLIAPLLGAYAVEERALLGENLWIKPLKFALALAIYLGTLAWYAAWLPTGTTRSRRYRVYAAGVLLAILAEMVWIGGAAAHGVASHFNPAPAMQAVYRAMGALAVFLTSASAVYGVLILRDPASRLDPAFRLSLGIGLIQTFVLTVLVAGAKAQGTGHAVGDSDLRVPHFLATHAMHVVPLAGYVAGHILPAAPARATVVFVGTAYAGFVAWTFAQSWMGHSVF